jgi:hypothetical protein
MKKSIADIAQDKWTKNKKLTLREFQINKIYTCSSIRDKMFPEHCRKGGLDLKRAYTRAIWEPIWDTMMAALIEKRKVENVAMAKWAAENRWAHFQ